MHTRTSPKAPTSVRYTVVIWLCAAAAIAYTGRNCLGVASQHVQYDLGLEVFWLSAAMSAFYWGYALLQVPAGYVGGKFGVRRALTCYAVAWSIACALVGAAVGGWSLVMGQLIFGVAQAGIFPCCAAAVSKWVPLSRRALATGALGSCMSIGGAIGAAVTGQFVEQIGWRPMFWIFAAPGLLWAAGFYYWYRDRPEDHRWVNDEEREIIQAGVSPSSKKSAPLSVLASVATSFDLWMICGQQFFRAAGYVFYATWFPEYLRETYGVSVKESGYLSALPFLAVVFGGFSGGALVDWLWRVTGSRRVSRQGVGIVSMLVCAALIAVAFLVEDAVTAVMFIAVGSFCASLAGSCAYTITIDKSGDYVAPIFGVMNMSGNIGAALCPLVVSKFVELTDQNWSLVLLLFVGNYLLAAACWMLLNPNGSIVERDR